MTYKAPHKLSDKHRDKNYRLLMEGEKLRCQRCNSLHWRVFYNALQCMGCRSWTGFDMGSGPDMRSVEWVNLQMKDSVDGRIDDPISLRSEFVVYADKLKSRISGTELLFTNDFIKGTWLMRSWPSKKPLTLEGEEITRLLSEK